MNRDQLELCDASFPIGEDLQCDLEPGHDGDHWDSERELLWDRWSKDQEKELHAEGLSS